MKTTNTIKLLIVALMLKFNPLAAQQSKTAPAWSNNTNIYEVNLRQYTKGGKFSDFAKELPRLKKMGVELLWLMPIHPVGVEGRKGSLGSYYAVKNYKEVSPEFGTMDDFKTLVKTAHEMGMKIIIDWVANHTSPDNIWVKEHPEFYTKDDKGKFVPPVPDWSDVIDLDYNNKAMRIAMIDAMNFWLKETDIDGFRCDVAEMVPTDFWIDCRTELDKTKKIFFLAEGGIPELHKAFDMTYSWNVYHAFKGFFKKEKTVDDVKKIIDSERIDFKPEDLRMYFTSNHDENSWNATEFEAFGKASSAMSVVTYTLGGMPLIYSGQESAFDHRLQFFDKDPIGWGNYSLQDFYTKLAAIKKNNPALDAGKEGGNFEWINTNNSNLIAYKRKKGNNEVITVINMSNTKQKINTADLTIKEYKDFLADDKCGIYELTNYDYSTKVSLELHEFGYLILIKK